MQVPDFNHMTRFNVPVTSVVPTRVKTIRSEMQNEPVLASLRHLSGKDYGFRKEAWRHWWREDGQAVAKEEERTRPRPTRDAGGEANPTKTNRLNVAADASLESEKSPIRSAKPETAKPE